MQSQELADRRTRTSTVDRRLISQHTAESLKIQAGTRHVYRQHTGRYGRPRHIYNRPVFTGSNTPFSDEEDGTEQLEAPEGVRVNTDLYEAYHPPQLDAQFGLMPQTTILPESDRGIETITSPRPRSFSPPMFTARRPPVIPLGSSLTRQNSVRRTARSRTSDFNDFTSRRRSVVRQSQERSSEGLRPEDSADGTWRFSSTQDQSEPEEASSSAARRRLPRRFFPSVATAWSDPHLRLDVEDVAPGDAISAPSQPAIFPPPPGQSSSQLWYSMASAAPPSPPIPQRSTDRSSVLPRLRRGGIRAPESLLSRFASPSAEDLLAELSNEVANSQPSSSVERGSISAENQAAPREDGGQLLTPRSISPPSDS